MSCRNWVVLVLWVMVSQKVWANPEYLADEVPAPKSLHDVPNSFRDFRLIPRLREGRLLRNLIGEDFPGLSPMVREAQVTLEPRLYARYRDEDNGTLRESVAGGGALRFLSGWLSDKIRVGLTGYTSQALAGDSDRGGTGLVRDDQSGYWAFGEAYVEAKLGDAFATRLFRQEMDLPYLNRNDSRMTPKSFESYVFWWKPEESLTLAAGHVAKMRDRTESTFISMAEAAGVEDAEDGLSTLGFRWDMRENLTLGAVNHYSWNTFNTVYTELRLVDSFGESDWSWKAALQFTDQRSVGDEMLGDFDIQTFGGQLGLGWNSLIASAAITHTEAGEELRKPFGGTPGFTSLMVSDFDRPEETAIRVGLSYDFADLGLDGLSAFANYAHGDVPQKGRYAGDNQDEWNVTVDYRPEKTLFKDLWFRVRLGWNERDDQRREEYRFIVNYSRTF
mgnify:CR=1 FL=1